MKDEIESIKFVNSTLPKSHFDILKIEELLQRDMKLDPTNLHRVGFYVLFIVTSGHGYHTIDLIDYKYQRGMVLTIRKGQIQKFFQTGDTKGYLILFTEDFIVPFLKDSDALKSLQLFNELLVSPKVQVDETGLFELIHLVNDLENEYLNVGDEHSPGIIRSLLHILITKLYRFKSVENSSVFGNKYLQDFIVFQNLVEQKCFSSKKVFDYASELGISTKKLNMVVQTTIGKSAKSFIDEIAILQIKRLLINTKLSVKEIAYAAGFEEPSNLFRYFKKYTGSSPVNFREAYL